MRTKILLTGDFPKDLTGNREEIILNEGKLHGKYYRVIQKNSFPWLIKILLSITVGLIAGIFGGFWTKSNREWWDDTFWSRKVQWLKPVKSESTSSTEASEKVEKSAASTSTPIKSAAVAITSKTVSTGEVDPAAFKKHLFPKSRGYRQIDQIKTLLENTVAKVKHFPPTITYHDVRPEKEHLDKVMHSPISDSPTKYFKTVEWFDYSNKHHFYIDFAHATSFGGAYRTYGCVQEERMFAEFPALPLLDFITVNGVHPCVDSYEEGGHSMPPPTAKASPFIIESVKREYDVSATPYGRSFQRAENEEIISGIKSVSDSEEVNIIGLAAVAFGEHRKGVYKMDDLVYHFEAAYLGFVGAKELSAARGWSEKTVIHTSAWGCGAFNNSERMMVAIQYLAAIVAGVDIVFHGVNKQIAGKDTNPNYNGHDVDAVTHMMDGLIGKGQAPKEILAYLLELNLGDDSWAPKVR